MAVLDEIQMIGRHKHPRPPLTFCESTHWHVNVPGDDQRGWAWTRALLGLQADVIHVCGDESAVAIVKRLARQMGDKVEVNRCVSCGVPRSRTAGRTISQPPAHTRVHAATSACHPWKPHTAL